jgi:hypothetical protein
MQRAAWQAEAKRRFIDAGGIFPDDLPELANRPASCKQGIRTLIFCTGNRLSLAQLSRLTSSSVE